LHFYRIFDNIHRWTPELFVIKVSARHLDRTAAVGRRVAREQ